MTGPELDGLLERIGWTDQALAGWLDVDRKTVWRWREGRARIPRAVEMLLRALAAYLRASDLHAKDRAFAERTLYARVSRVFGMDGAAGE